MTISARKALVSGAGGFIGGELCRQVSTAGYSLVRLVSAGGEPFKSEGGEPGSPVFSGDIRDRELLGRALQGVDVVFHLAGIAHVDAPDQAALDSVNVAGSLAVAETAASAGVRRLVYFSSCLAQAAAEGRADATAYGMSKFRAEQQLLELAGRLDLEVVILRPVNVYGPGMKGNIGAMLRLIQRGLLPPLPKLASRCSLIGREDLCRAALLAAEHASASGKTYTVTDGESYRLNDIEAAIYQALGRHEPRWHSPRFLFYTAALAAGWLNRLTGLSKILNNSVGLRTYHNLLNDSLYDNHPICQELGFSPEQSFYTALPGLIGIK